MVTRSRRRGGASTEATVAGGGGSEAEPADLHVPVKKRGSRKR
ncbi:hypothetical protein [Nocardioides alcanivorans]|nr:hypothetical protein [Nocardioides alcanivorans]